MPTKFLNLKAISTKFLEMCNWPILAESWMNLLLCSTLFRGSCAGGYIYLCEGNPIIIFGWYFPCKMTYIMYCNRRNIVRDMDEFVTHLVGSVLNDSAILHSGSVFKCSLLNDVRVI